MKFKGVPHTYIALVNYLEVCTLTSNFGLRYVLEPLMRADEELGQPREILDSFEIKILNFASLVFQVQYNGAYPMGFGEPFVANDIYFVSLDLEVYTLCRVQSTYHGVSAQLNPECELHKCSKNGQVFPVFFVECRGEAVII